MFSTGILLSVIQENYMLPLLFLSRFTEGYLIHYYNLLCEISTLIQLSADLLIVVYTRIEEDPSNLCQH